MDKRALVIICVLAVMFQVSVAIYTMCKINQIMDMIDLVEHTLRGEET